ncbi:MAG: ABC transporter permease subunit [Oscillospiraceae bacterium]|jgi:L-cystine transport system permease protein|nr:ABC transporter permease subunit [Oscillospiraceae bacterium]
MDILYMLSLLDDCLTGVPVTLLISAGGMLLAAVMAALLLFIRKANVPVVSQVVDLYLLIMRSVPLVVLLFVVFYGLPAMINTARQARGLPPQMNALPEIALVIIAFALSTSATVYHNIQSALLSVNPAQLEAAYSVGMTEGRAFRRIIFPQAAMVLARPLGNTFIIVVKASAISFIVSCRDVMGAAKIAGTPGFHFIEVYVGAALIYWAMSVLLSRGVDALERRAMRSLRPVT